MACKCTPPLLRSSEFPEKRLQSRQECQSYISISQIPLLVCHGYEERGAASAGVLAIGDLAKMFMSMHMGRMAKRLADRITIYTDGNEELAEQLLVTVANDPAMRIDNRSIQRLAKGPHGSEVDITLASGEVVTEGFIVSPLISFAY